MEREFEHRLTAVEDRAKSNTIRLDDMEKRQDDLDELVGTVKVLAVREENVESDVKEIKADVKEIAGKSGKRWDGMVDKIVWAIAAAVIGFLLSRIGL
jgi:hypothetical protein